MAMLSAEAKFRGITYGVYKLLWIMSVLKDLGIEYVTHISLHCDNKATVENRVQQDCTKNDRHFIKENLKKSYSIFFESQLANMLTKRFLEKYSIA